MAVSAETVEHLARDTVQIANPETALRALAALRNELDALEPELVARALQAGASWSHIARALGISKQAAHRKFRYLSEEPPESITVEPKILVTSEARKAIRLARQEAKALGQPVVCTEHILLGILQVFLCVVLVFLVLMHSGKDSGLSGAFGVGTGAGPFGGGSLVERNLNRWTIVFAVAFVINTILLIKIS